VTSREAIGFQYETRSKSLVFTATQTTLTLTFAGTEYTVLLTPYETVLFSNQTTGPLILNPNILPPVLGGNNYQFAGSNLAVTLNSQQYLNAAPISSNPSINTDNPSSSLNAQNDAETFTPGSAFQSILPPNYTYSATWVVSNMAPGTWFLRVGDSPVSDYSWDFAPNQTTAITTTARGSLAFSFTLPPLNFFPWRILPVFVPIKQNYLWIVVVASQWNTAGTSALPSFLSSNSISLQTSCTNGAAAQISGQPVVGTTTYLVYPLLITFGSVICTPAWSYDGGQGGLYNSKTSGYINPVSGVPDPNYMPSTLSGSTLASSALLAAQTGWSLTAASVAVPLVPLYKVNNAAVTLSANFTGFGNVFGSNYRDVTKNSWIRFDFGLVSGSKKK